MTDTIPLGILQTLTIQDHNAEGFDVGEFVLPVTIPAHILHTSADKSGIIKSTIAQHLASAIKDTEVPSHLWYFETDAQVIRMIPSFQQVLAFGQ